MVNSLIQRYSKTWTKQTRAWENIVYAELEIANRPERRLCEHMYFLPKTRASLLACRALDSGVTHKKRHNVKNVTRHRTQKGHMFPAWELKSEAEPCSLSAGSLQGEWLNFFATLHLQMAAHGRKSPLLIPLLQRSLSKQVRLQLRNPGIMRFGCNSVKSRRKTKVKVLVRPVRFGKEKAHFSFHADDTIST